MSKQILDELQFEKNKRDILKHTHTSKLESERAPVKVEETKKYAWEYELENYRKSKVVDKFQTFGAICGILALILTILMNWNFLIQFLMKF